MASLTEVDSWWGRSKGNLVEVLGDLVNSDAQDGAEGAQIIGGQTLGGKNLHQSATEQLKVGAVDAAGCVAVPHVLELAHDLQGVVQGGDHVVQPVGDQVDLLQVLGVAGQIGDGHITEGSEGLDQGGVGSEQPAEKEKSRISRVRERTKQRIARGSRT